MSDIVEEKVHMDTKILLSIVGIFVLINFIDYFASLSKQSLENEVHIVSIGFVYFTIIFILIALPIFMKSATKLVLINYMLLVKFVFKKPLEIPLKNIERIEKLDYAGNRPFHLVKTKHKNFNTLLISMSFKKKSLDIFIEELQLRVHKAKQVNKIT